MGVAAHRGFRGDQPIHIGSTEFRRLRTALIQNDAPDLIRTVRSAGYALDSAAL